MDLFTHGLWGMTVVRKRKILVLAFLFGILPDLLGASPSFIMDNVFRIPLENISPFYFNLYYFTHSLFAFLLIFFALYLFLKKYLILALPYLGHLILDLLSHEAIYANRPFYPFSDYAFQGMLWEDHWWILALSALCLIIINLVFYLKKWKNTPKQSKT